MAKRIAKVANVTAKFKEAPSLTDIQQRFFACKGILIFDLTPSPPFHTIINLRLCTALSGSVTALEELHGEMANAYTKGVVEGYTTQTLSGNLEAVKFMMIQVLVQ